MRRTLPPPEWSPPRSASGVALDWLIEYAAIPRKKGPRAELGWLRARLKAARLAKDADAERLLGAELARALVARGTELDVATKLARRSLVLGEDPKLREELSSWFAVLGEPGLAGATLLPLLEGESGARLVHLLTRIAVFHGRNGDARAAAEALADASEANPSDPVPGELRGALGAWASEALAPRDAALSYLEAAERRGAAGDRAGAFEDLLRAFEMAPEVTAVAERLAAELATRGRAGAADEVLREHARVVGAEGSAIHRGRLRDALAEGDAFRALGAGLDLGLDRTAPAATLLASPGGKSTTEEVTFEQLLTRAGLAEVAASRLELAAEAASGPQRARLLEAAARLLAEEPGNTERAADLWIEAAANDVASDTAREALRAHAERTGDHGPLSEALLRLALGGAQAGNVDRRRCFRELALLGDQGLGAPGLALWAARHVLAADPSDQEMSRVVEEVSPRAMLQDVALAATRAQLEGARGLSRGDALRMSAAALRGRPDDAEEYVRVLSELVESAPEERAFQTALERVLRRLGDRPTLLTLLQGRLERSPERQERERARLGIAALHRSQGDEAAARAVLEGALAEGAGSPASVAMLLVSATRAGDELLRARALQKLAILGDSRVGSLLSSIASELYALHGDPESARVAAEQACHAEPTPRAIRALGRAVLDGRDRVTAVALEREAAVVLPRAGGSRAIAEAFDALGEPENALSWTQRWLALRPGDRDATRALLTRVTASGDPARIADALGWVLAQAQPLGELAPEVTRALRHLLDTDSRRALSLSRRALEVFGPRDRLVRDTVLHVAESLGERSLAVAVLERELAAGVPGADRPRLTLALGQKRREARDADGAARCLVRALADGADPAQVLADVDTALPPDTSDGEVSLREARAEALAGISSADLEGTARAFREYGAALWDLAEDHDGAVTAWERAATLDADRGPERLARDLVSFAGHAEACRRLQALAARRKERVDQARLLASAAGAALDGRLVAEALAISLLALETDPSRADVLGIAERAAGDQIDELERAYDLVGSAALGIYGERALHYRAARHLERLGKRDRALRHAVAAFEAVPGEGVTFVLMMRLAERVGDSSEAVAAVERVASLSKSAEERSVWLRRAALVAGTGDEGKRQRVEVLLRALDANPQRETFRAFGGALTDLVNAIPEETDIAQLRFERALKSMLPRLEGPDGARVGVDAGRIACMLFNAPDLALGALERAARADASIDEYHDFLPLASALASHPGPAAEFVAVVTDLITAPYSNIESPLIELGLAIGEALGGDRAAVLAVRAAERAPDNADLVRRAESAARASGDRALIDAVLAVVPVERRVKDLFDRTERALARRDSESAIRALEDLRGLEGVAPEVRREAALKLRQLYRATERPESIEALLREELVNLDDADEQVQLARELGELLAERGAFDEAASALDAVLSLFPENRELLEDLCGYAERGRLLDREAEALSRLLDMEEDAPGRLGLLRRLASTLTALGDGNGALVRHRQVLEIDPGDPAALAAVSLDMEERGDWEGLAESLSRRAGLATDPDEAHQLLSRRAEVLESRLGRPHEAQALRLETARRSGDPRALSEALEELAVSSMAAPEARAAMLVEAARSMLLAGDMSRALGQAQRAARIARSSAEPQLLARSLEYRMRGAGTREEALATVAELRALPEPAAPSERQLKAFLLAEALDASHPDGEGMKELSLLHAEVGPLPLIALGIAERLGRAGAFDRSLAMYDLALAGDLAELRSVGQVAMDAASAAERAGLYDQALQYLEAAVDSPDTHEHATRARDELLARRMEAPTSPTASEPPPSFGDVFRPSEPAPSLREPAGPVEPAPSIEEALRRAEDPGPSIATALQAAPERAEAEPVIELRSRRPEQLPEPVIDLVRPSERLRPTSLAAMAPKKPASRVPKVAPARSEDELLGGLARGSIEAGIELMELLEPSPERAQDLVSIGRRVALLSPGDRSILERLRAAAIADRNLVYARALEHVLAAFEPGAPPVPPPPLADQMESSERIQAVLFRDVVVPAAEALGIVWNGASHLFRREPASYGLTGIERVSPTGKTPVADLFATATRLLGMTRTGLFHRREVDAVTLDVTLLSPPALVLTGDVREPSPALAYHLGAELAGTLPEYVLVRGVPQRELVDVLRALVLAFGPPERHSPGIEELASLAEKLWESIPARSQRRLRELCDNPLVMSHEEALAAAGRAGRRAGLFVCGDLTTSVREICAELGISARALETPGGLSALCSSSPEVADVVRLATGTEYASARWQPARPTAGHPSGSWSLV